MTRKRVIVGIALTFAVTLSACGASPAAPDAPTDENEAPEAGPDEEVARTAAIVMNYFAQAEQGGYWDAMQNQYATSDGLVLDVVQGGPGINTIPQVAAGSYDFGVGQADDLVAARTAGMDIVALLAPIDKTLFVMMSHREANIESFADLNGHEVARRSGALYWDYLKNTFDLNDVLEVNFADSMAEFKMNPNLVQQGYATSDVFLAEKADIDVVALSVGEDGGYNPYAQVLFTTEEMIESDPDFVRTVVHSMLEGWKNFQADPADAKVAVLAANSDTDPEVYDASARILVDDGFYSDDLGYMTEERWETLKEQIVEIGMIDEGFDIHAMWTNDFLP